MAGYSPVSVVSGYGQSTTECDKGLNPLLTLITLAGAALGGYLVFNKLTAGAGIFGGLPGRTFNREENSINVLLNDVFNQFWHGMLRM